MRRGERQVLRTCRRNCVPCCHIFGFSGTRSIDLDQGLGVRWYDTINKPGGVVTTDGCHIKQPIYPVPAIMRAARRVRTGCPSAEDFTRSQLNDARYWTLIRKGGGGEMESDFVMGTFESTQAGT